MYLWLRFCLSALNHSLTERSLNVAFWNVEPVFARFPVWCGRSMGETRRRATRVESISLKLKQPSRTCVRQSWQRRFRAHTKQPKYDVKFMKYSTPCIPSADRFRNSSWRSIGDRPRFSRPQLLSVLPGNVLSSKFLHVATNN